MAKKITKELSNAISGKTSEISRPYKELSKLDVIKFLNWYSGFGDINDIKGYAVDYVNQHYGKDKADHISKFQASEFQSYGAICRMLNRGYTSKVMNLEKIVDEQFHKMFSLMNEPQKDEFVKTGVRPKAKKTVHDGIPYFEYIEMNIDNIAFGEKNKPEIPKELGATPAQIKSYCESIIEQLDKDLANEYIDKKIALKIRTYVQGIIDEQKAKRKTVTRTRKVSPAKIARSVKYCRDNVCQFLAVSPIDVIGKKKLYAYDNKTRRLYCYVALAGGFTFKGTSLQNFDIKRSSFKTIRDKDKFFTMNNISKLNEAYNGIKQTVKEASGRFNDQISILIYS